MSGRIVSALGIHRFNMASQVVRPLIAQRAGFSGPFSGSSVSPLVGLPGPKFFSTSRSVSQVPPIIARHSLEFPIPQLLKDGDTILVANRGIAAERLVTTAKTMGFKVVQIVAKGDAPASLADRHIMVPHSNAIAYLDGGKIAKIAKQTGASAVMVGWGFGSENPDLHGAIRQQGIMVVGPEPAVVASMGDKTRAREIAIAAGAPVVPGTGILESVNDALLAADKMGYPVIIKAASGGGGKGMRVVHEPAFLATEYQLAKDEALASFGDFRVFMEKFVSGQIKHIEVQVAGDLHGDVVSFGTRDCSAQRRKQKTIEEAPAPKQYWFLEDAAVKIAKEAGYSGVGTVEFIVETLADGTIVPYFMEVNSRLQVEHTITEQIHQGLDLVALQLAVAKGERIADITKNVVRLDHVHAIEARFIRESLGKIPTSSGTVWNTVPSSGPFFRLIDPNGYGVRIEGNTQISGVNPNFDSNFHNAIFVGRSREEAIARTRVGLVQTHFGGSDTSNTTLLYEILGHSAFQDPQKIHINWLEAEMMTMEFRKAVLDPAHPANFHHQVDLLAVSVGNATVNGSLVSGVVGSIPADLRGALPVPEFPVTPTWPLYGQIYSDAGGGVAGSVAVVAAWKQSALVENRMLLGNTRFRDWGQTANASRDNDFEKQMVAPFLDQLPFAWCEIGGGASTHSDLKFKYQDPVLATRRIKELMPNQITSLLGRDLACVAYGDNPLHPDAVPEIYRSIGINAGIQKARIFQGMNDINRLKPAVLAAASAGGILDICMVFHKEYTSQNYAKFLSEMFKFSQENGFSDRVIFTIKDAQGVIGLQELEKMKDVPALLDSMTGERQLIGIHSHDAQGVTAAVYAKSAEYGFRHCDVCNEKLATTNTQPSIGQVVQLLAGTPWDPQFPIEHMDLLAPHDLSVLALNRPLMPANEITSNQVREYGLPPGMTNNVRQQFLSAGGDPEQFPRFLKLYGIVLNKITCTTGVTPYSKDAGEIALWVLLADPKGDIKTETDIARYMGANAAAAPNSTKNLFRGHKGVEQFQFHPEVKAAFDALTSDQAPSMIVPSGDYRARIDARKQELEAKYSREVPRHLAVIEDMFPGDVQAFLQYQKVNGIFVEKLPLQIKLRGMQPGEELNLMIDGRCVQFKMLTVTPANDQGVRTVFMEVQNRLVQFPVVDKAVTAKLGASRTSAVIVSSPAIGQLVSPMPGTVVELKVKTGDSVKKGDVIAVVEAMKMRTSVVADKAGVVTLSIAEKAGVVREQLLATIS